MPPYGQRPSAMSSSGERFLLALRLASAKNWRLMCTTCCSMAKSVVASCSVSGGSSTRRPVVDRRNLTQFNSCYQQPRVEQLIEWRVYRECMDGL